MQWPYYQECPTPAVHIKQKLCLASPVVLTHPQNLEWQKNGTLFDNQNNQSFEIAKKWQISVNHQIAGIAKKWQKLEDLPFFYHFFAIPICHPPCHSQREPQFHQALFWPSLLLFNLILPTNAGPVVSVVWDDRAAACPNVSEMRVAFADVLYTEEQR